MKRLRRALFAVAAAAIVVSVGAASQPAVSIPEFWSEELLHDYELPLATPENSPKHVSRDYYYALPERVLYKSYPIYHPSQEPPGYLDKLRTLEPETALRRGDAQDRVGLDRRRPRRLRNADRLQRPDRVHGDGARSEVVRAPSRSAHH